MTTTDKTGEKLAASVRRTKENVAQNQNPEPAAPAPVKKTPAKRATAAAPAQAKPAPARRAAAKKTTTARQPAKATVAATPSDAGDSYQGGRRIWPD